MVASIVFLFAVTGIQFLVPSAHHVLSLVGTGMLVGLFAVVALAMLWPDLATVIKQQTSHMRQARGSRQASQPPQQERSAKQEMGDRAA
jgi:hypothetical protein